MPPGPSRLSYSEKIQGVGSNFDPDEFAETLVKARVNSITCFARCHHGWLYFESKKFPERKHPALRRDLLKHVWPVACVCRYCRGKMSARGLEPGDAGVPERFGIETVNQFKEEMTQFIRDWNSHSKELDVIEDVIPLFNVNLFVGAPRAVRQAVIVPDGASLALRHEDPYLIFQVPRIDGHAMASLAFA